jgi:hypothetical protein
MDNDGRPRLEADWACIVRRNGNSNGEGIVGRSANGYRITAWIGTVDIAVAVVVNTVKAIFRGDRNAGSVR